MKSIAAVMGVILMLALFTREFNWKARGLMIAAIIAMIVLLMR